jgi:hypothetical protein
MFYFERWKTHSRVEKLFFQDEHRDTCPFNDRELDRFRNGDIAQIGDGFGSRTLKVAGVYSKGHHIAYRLYGLRFKVRQSVEVDLTVFSNHQC